jgi:hypothetical protein
LNCGFASRNLLFSVNTRFDNSTTYTCYTAFGTPGKVRQAMFVFPKGTNMEGVKMYAEIEVKGIRRKINRACHHETAADGALPLRRNI